MRTFLFVFIVCCWFFFFFFFQAEDGIRDGRVTGVQTCALPISIETRLPVGMCRNSFGPCAFECGPRTPVIRNCAFGNFSPSMPMNGMLPPSPMYTGGAPKASCEACATACSSQGDSAGAFQPLDAFSSFSSTLQP